MMDSVLVGGFFHWVSVYDSILTNMYGQDREDVIAVFDNDAEFDKWLVEYDRKRKIESKVVSKGQSPGQEARKADYLKRFAVTHGGEEDD